MYKNTFTDAVENLSLFDIDLVFFLFYRLSIHQISNSRTVQTKTDRNQIYTQHRTLLKASGEPLLK